MTAILPRPQIIIDNDEGLLRHEHSVAVALYEALAKIIHASGIEYEVAAIEEAERTIAAVDASRWTI